MSCDQYNICGGCQYRDMSFEDYVQKKIQTFNKIIAKINQPQINQGSPIFIPDGQRRRASLSFEYRKKQLALGFNQKQTNQIVPVSTCALLTPGLNQILPQLHQLITDLCQVNVTQKNKKKLLTTNLSKGSIFVCEVDNGIDVVLTFDHPLTIEHRQIIFEFSEATSGIIRISHQAKDFAPTETIIEKTKPFITISGITVYVPASTFLQASKQAEQALIDLVTKYLGSSQGRVADLFCGVGTFSYPLCQNPNNSVWALDSSQQLLDGFRQTINKNMISNIRIEPRNLFKYPLTQEELAKVDIVVFDPPRAGAAAQVREIKTPVKVIAVSCNPNTFINDANQLIANGYHLEELTLVDQFTYSNHSELVALFTNQKN